MEIALKGCRFCSLFERFLFVFCFGGCFCGFGVGFGFWVLGGFW
jgi:hypothetical protein